MEGTAYLSAYTHSHVPNVPLSMQMGGIAHAVMSGNPGNVANAIAQVLPTTRYPIVSDNFRVGFLYPHRMNGFAIPFMHDGSVKTLPWLGRLTCIVPAAEYASLDHRIVKYRARVMVIGKSDVVAVYPGISDDTYDQLRQSGRLYFVSMIEDDTAIEFFEESPHQLIAGSHFLETHWESPDAITDGQFSKILDAAIKAGASEVGYSQPQHMVERVKHLHVWNGGSYYLTQPQGFPYFHLQVNAPLNEHPQRDDIRKAFDAMAAAVIRNLNAHYGGGDEKDVNSVDDYTRGGYTILQSTAARSITDPVLAAVRGYLERKP